MQTSRTDYRKLLWGLVFLGVWIAALAWLVQAAINAVFFSWLNVLPLVDYLVVFYAVLAGIALAITFWALKNTLEGSTRSDLGQFIQGMVLAKYLQGQDTTAEK